MIPRKKIVVFQLHKNQIVGSNKNKFRRRKRRQGSYLGRDWRIFHHGEACFDIILRNKIETRVEGHKK